MSHVAAADADTRPVVVIVEGDGSSWTTELRQAIARELHTPAIAPDDARAKAARGTLVISLSNEDEEVLVRYKPAQGDEIARRVHTPPDHARKVRATTLLAGNLVRNEAQEILDAARRPSGPSTGAASGTVPGATPNPTADDPSKSPADAGTNPGDAKPGDTKPGDAPKPGDPNAPAAEGPASAPAGDAAKAGDAQKNTVLQPPPMATNLTPAERPCVKRQASEPFHAAAVSLVYPVATNYKYPRVRTAYSFNLLYGQVGQVKGLASGVASNIDCDMKGVQVQLLVARAGGEVHGAQVSGLASLADESVYGIQASQIFNRTPHLVGLQFGAANLAREFKGAQIGLVNVAKKGDGLQAGMVNVAAEQAPGLQIGLVNVGRKVGWAQIGLVNVAEDAEVQVGLFSFSKTSYIRPVAWIGSSTYRSINAGVRFDTRWVYFQFYFGYVDGSKVNDFVSGGAFGFHALKPDQEGFLLDLENGTQQRFGEKTEENDNLRQMAHIIAGWRVSKRLAFFGGMGIVFGQRTKDSFVGPDVLAGAIF